MRCVRITTTMKLGLAAVAIITMNTVTSAGMSTAMSRNTSTAMMKRAAAAKLILMKGMNTKKAAAADMNIITVTTFRVTRRTAGAKSAIRMKNTAMCAAKALKTAPAVCVKKVYILKNLGCAHCAAKMEHRIKELPGVEYANISYVTKQLRLSAVNHEAVLPAIKEICTSIESGVEVVPREGEGPFNFKTQVYVLENLGCANCAAKMERAINELPQVSEATITFATKQLKVTARDFDGLLQQMQKICSGIESGVAVKEREGAAVLAPHVEERKRGSFSLSSETMTLAELVVGGVLFIAAEFLGLIPEAYYLYVLVAAYVLLGGRVVLAAVKNLLSGNLFDENFLMTIATLGAFVISAYEEAVGVMFFYRVGEYFEHRAVEKSRGQIMDAVDMRPETVNLLVGEEVRIIPAADAHVGDILLVRAGDRIPLDGVVIEGDSLVDTSPVTGEPVPVRKHYGDEITSGCINTSGMLKIRVEKVLSESMVTRILDSVENAAASKPQIDRFITRFARVYTPFVVVVATLTALVPGYITGNWQHWIYTALTFLVISCPCALVLSVPLAFFSGIGAGSRYGILFKGGSVMEALKNVHAVVMDKTGTVTKGNFVVQKVMPAPGVDETEVLQLCADVEAISAHPIAVSIVNAAKERGLTPVRPVSFKEIAGEGIVAQTLNGTVICGSKKLMARYKISCGGFENYAYGTEVLLAQNGRYMGHIVIADTIKDDAVEAVKEIKAMGLTTAMLTGDAEASAQAVAAAAGIDEVRAKLLPQDKLNELGRLRSKYGSVMFVGDGINDAPALARADVGIAIGAGTDIAIESADLVLMKNDLLDVAGAVQLGHAVIRNIKQNLFWALFYNAICIPVAAGVFYPWLGIKLSPMLGALAMSFSSVFVVTNALRLRFFNPVYAADTGADASGAAAHECRVEAVDILNTNKKERVDTMKKVLDIEGMMCQHCVAHVNKALSCIEGVEAVAVSLENKNAAVTLAADVSDDALVKAVVDAGYEVKGVKTL